MLGVVLIIALVIAYQFLDNPLPIEASQAEASQAEKTRHENEQPKKKDTEELRSDEADNQPEKASPKPTTSGLLTGDKYRGPSNPSDGYKQAATNQWFTDYMITNGNMTGKEYIRLLDESSNQTELVLKLCKDKYLASRITDAARLGQSPEWIGDEIETRTSNRYENETNKESEW